MTVKRIVRFIGIAFAVLVCWIASMTIAVMWIESKVPAELPTMSVLTNSWNYGYILAKGSWTIDDDQQAFPFQTSSIFCDRQAKVCKESRASIGANKYLNTDSDEYGIVKWDAYNVVFINETPSCVTYTYTIDRKSETIVGVREIKPNTIDPACKILKHKFTVRLSDGTRITQAARQNHPKLIELIFFPLKIFGH